MRKIVSAFLGLAMVLTFSALATLTTATTASAASDLPSQIQHYLECLNWLGTDPAQHAANCGPGHEFTGQFSNAWGSENYVPPATPTCPERTYVHPSAYVLTHSREGSDCHHTCPTAYVPSDLGTPQLLLTGGRGGCRPECNTAYTPSEDGSASVVLVGCGSYCPEAFVGPEAGVPDLLLVTSTCCNPVSSLISPQDSLLMLVGGRNRNWEGSSNCQMSYDRPEEQLLELTI